MHSVSLLRPVSYHMPFHRITFHVELMASTHSFVSRSRPIIKGSQQCLGGKVEEANPARTVRDSVQRP